MADGRMARRPPPRERRDGASTRTPAEHRQPYIPPQPGIPEPYATPEEPVGPTRGAPYRWRRADQGGYRDGRVGDDTGEWRRDQQPRHGARGAAAVPPRQYPQPDAWSAPPGYGAPTGPAGGFGYDSYGPPASDSYGPPPTNGYGPPASDSYGPPPTNGYGPPPATNGYGPPPPTNGYGPPATNGYGPPPPTNGYGPPATNGYGPPPSTNGYGAPENGYGPSTSRGDYRSPADGYDAPVNGYGPSTGQTNGYGQPPVDAGPATDGRGFRRSRSHRTPSPEYGPPPGYGDAHGGYPHQDRYPGPVADPRLGGWPEDARPGGWPEDARSADARQRGDQHAEWISRGNAAARPATPHETGRWSASRGSWVPTDQASEVPDFAIGRFEETGDVRRGPVRGDPRVVDGVDWSERMDQRPAWQPHTWDDAPTGRSTDWSEVPLPPPRPRAEPRMRAATTPTERDPAADRLVGEAVPTGTVGAALSPLLWFTLAIGAYVVAVFVFNKGPERAEAIRVAIGLLPWFGVASTMSVGLAVVLRWIGAGWRATGLGFAAAVVSGTVTTILHSFLSG
jgi:hypothetical protein